MSNPEMAPLNDSAPLKTIERRTGWQAVNLRELIRYRDLFFYLVVRDVKIQYKQTVLGFGWAILRPVFSMVVFSVVFGRLAKVPSDGIPYPLFSLVALVPWTYFQTALNASTTSLIMAAGMISKVYFPRAVIPLAPVASGMVDFVIALGLACLMAAYYGLPPTVGLAAVPLLVLVMVFTAAGAGLWLSVLAVQYRDVRFAMQFVSQLLMYAAPVVWPASLIPAPYRVLYGVYPMAGVIEGFRSAMVGTTPMPWDLITVGGFSGLVLFVSGLAYFRRAERVLADVA